MRTLLPVLALLATFMIAPATAQERPDEAEAPKPFAEEHRERLDALFADLKRERNEKAAERISQRIWREWFRSGSATVDLMMHWSEEATKEKKFDVALDFLDQAIVLAPDYPEAWNRRATVHFLMNDYAKSMADIERTLRLEPRHFGALSGMATILKENDEKELAMRAYERILDVYPMMREAQEELVKLADELAGEAI